MRVGVAVIAVLACAAGCAQGWRGDPPGVTRDPAASSGAEQPESGAVSAELLEPLDEAHDGVLADGDFVLEVDGSLYDAYAFQTVAGASVVVTMRSESLEPYLHLIGPRGGQLAHGGAPPGETGVAEIILVAPETGEYRVYANAAEPAMRGPYALRIVVEPAPRPVEASPTEE